MPDPQPVADPIADLLRGAPVPDPVRADAWDAFHQSAHEDEFAQRVQGLPLPDETKAQLWDHKAGVVRPPDFTAHAEIPTADQLAAAQPLQPGTSVQLNPATLGTVPEQDMVPHGPLRAIPFDAVINTVRGLVRGATIGTTDPNDTWAAKGATLAAAALPLMGSTRSLLRGAETAAEGAGLFSRLDQAMQRLPALAHPSKVLSVAKNATSADEIGWRGLPEWLAGFGNTPVSRDAVQGFLADRPLDVHAQVLGEPMAAPSGSGYTFPPLPGHADATKYSQYQVPGGTNYRETLLTLPDAGEQGFQKLIAQRDATQQAIYRAQPLTSQGHPDRFAPAPPELVQQYNDLQTRIDAMQGQQFKSSHFDQPNILAHVRSNERTLPTGEPGRFLEEVQSDWHQRGKDNGYQQPIPPEGSMSWNDYVKAKGLSGSHSVFGDYTNPDFAAWMKSYEQSVDIANKNVSAVPDAPFKEQWPDLALKQQLLDVATRPDLQWLGFTNGQTQAARYDLSKQVDGMSWMPWPAGGADHGILSAFKDGDQVIKQQMSRDQVASYIGKETASKLLAAPGNPRFGNAQELNGIDLKVGGAGMHEFYDRLLPARLQKIVTPFGGKIEPMPVPPTRSVAAIDADMDALDTRHAASGVTSNYRQQLNALQTERNAAQAPKASGWMVRLTPAMKAQMLKAGLPLLTVAGAVAASGQTPPPPPAPDPEGD